MGVNLERLIRRDDTGHLRAEDWLLKYSTCGDRTVGGAVVERAFKESSLNVLTESMRPFDRCQRLRRLANASRLPRKLKRICFGLVRGVAKVTDSFESDTVVPLFPFPQRPVIKNSGSRTPPDEWALVSPPHSRGNSPVNPLWWLPRKTPRTFLSENGACNIIFDLHDAIITETKLQVRCSWEGSLNLFYSSVSPATLRPPNFDILNFDVMAMDGDFGGWCDKLGTENFFDLNVFCAGIQDATSKVKGHGKDLPAWSAGDVTHLTDCAMTSTSEVKASYIVLTRQPPVSWTTSWLKGIKERYAKEESHETIFTVSKLFCADKGLVNLTSKENKYLVSETVGIARRFSEAFDGHATLFSFTNEDGLPYGGCLALRNVGISFNRLCRANII